MNRIVLGLEYDGSHFHGWQWQQGKRSVQQEVETALSKIADQAVRINCAGRTDAGVHALAQVVHFDTSVDRDLRGWVMGGNSQLAPDVRILWARLAVEDFHARYSAIARFYRYIILNRPVHSALLHHQTTWCYEKLDVTKMQQAGKALIGEHDFSSFRAQSCQSHSPNRCVYFIEVYQDQDQVIIDIAANAFVHHMVRNIVGVLMEIGVGKRPTDWTDHLLQVKDRKQGGKTAPAQGLYLGGVCYPEKYGLANHAIFKKLPPDAKRFD